MQSNRKKADTLVHQNWLLWLPADECASLQPLAAENQLLLFFKLTLIDSLYTSLLKNIL